MSRPMRASLLDLRRGHNCRGTQALRRRRLGRDRRLVRRPLALLRRGRRPGGEGRRRGDAAGNPRRRPVAPKPAPAFAAGCAVVLKPASQTPLSALFLAELEEEAGLPPGWLSVVAGSSSEIGDVLVEDERVKAITFTGSGGVGWKLKERASKKKVNLELGNATPVIVAADADLDAAAAGKAAKRFSFAGQSSIP